MSKKLFLIFIAIRQERTLNDGMQALLLIAWGIQGGRRRVQAACPAGGHHCNGLKDVLGVTFHRA